MLTDSKGKKKKGLVVMSEVKMSSTKPPNRLSPITKIIHDVVPLPIVPTGIHLQHEIALWICTLLLTAASSHTLYRESYLTTLGDLYFLGLIALWSSRHWVIRWLCTWVDNCSVGRSRAWWPRGPSKRRRLFQRWLHWRRASCLRVHQIPAYSYHLACLAAGLLSPLRAVHFAREFLCTYGMAGQYCDASAAAGVVMGGAGEADGAAPYHAKSTGKNVGASASMAVLPQPSERHTAVLLGLARAWGACCGVCYAVVALVRGDASGWAPHESGGVASWFCGLRGCLRPFLGLLGLAAEQAPHGSHAGKKYKRKQSSSSAPDAPSQPPMDSSHEYPPDLHGKLSFRRLPPAIRSQALHVQQMRTSDTYRRLQKLWQLCPPSQLLVALAAGKLLLLTLLFSSLGGYDWLIGNTSGTAHDHANVETTVPHFGPPLTHLHPNAPMMGSIGGPAAHDLQMSYWANAKPFPAPKTFDNAPPSWTAMCWLCVAFGSASSLFFYGRITYPIPEFVAGTNVLKALRTETRIIGGNAGKWSKHKEKEHLPWSEQYKSITTENRLRLYYKVAVLRILENVLICAILPQTQIVCRVTSHCEPGPLLWGPSGVVGIAGRRFKGSGLLTTSYDVLVKDDLVTRIIVLSTMIITGLILMGQMTIMNRTYLAIMGYISGEWALVNDEKEVVDSTPSSHSRSKKSWAYDLLGLSKPPSHTPRRTTLMQWDPKRRYQKGDRIAYDDATYEAMSNSPEGPPFDPFLRAAHDLFKDELGHCSNSRVIALISMGCAALASFLCLVMLFWRNAGWNFIPLVLCLAASLVAGYAMSHVGERDFGELLELSEEIAQGLAKK